MESLIILRCGTKSMDECAVGPGLQNLLRLQEDWLIRLSVYVESFALRIPKSQLLAKLQSHCLSLMLLPRTVTKTKCLPPQQKKRNISWSFFEWVLLPMTS